MYPIVDYIIHEIENPIPANRRVTPSITGPKIAHKSTVLTTQCTTESMIVCIQCLSGNCILNGYIDSRKFLIFISFTRTVHVTIERKILIQPPSTGTVIDHNVTNRITPK